MQRNMHRKVSMDKTPNGWNESHLLTAAKAKRAATSWCASTLFLAALDCSNPAINLRFKNYTKASKKSDLTLHIVQITKLKKVQLTLTPLWDVLVYLFSYPDPQKYACSTLLVRSVVVISDVIWGWRSELDEGRECGEGAGRNLTW